MPLFMFLSGYVASFSNDLSLKKKVIRLVIPFISWYLVSYWITQSYHSIGFYDYIIRWIKSPDYGLWFLWVLFLCYSILAISLKLEKYMSKELSLLLSYGIVYFIPLNILGFGLLKWHFVFFAVGYLIAQHQRWLSKYRYFTIASIFLFPVLFIYWHRLEPPAFLPQLITIFKAYHIPGSRFISVSFKYIVAFLGIAVIYLIINWTKNINYIGVGLCYLGAYTMDIYVLHTFFLGYGIGSGYIKIISAFIMALCISLFFSTIVRRIPYVRTVFLGTK